MRWLSVETDNGRDTACLLVPDSKPNPSRAEGTPTLVPLLAKRKERVSSSPLPRLARLPLPPAPLSLALIARGADQCKGRRQYYVVLLSGRRRHCCVWLHVDLDLRSLANLARLGRHAAHSAERPARSSLSAGCKPMSLPQACSSNSLQLAPTRIIQSASHPCVYLLVLQAVNTAVVYLLSLSPCLSRGRCSELVGATLRPATAQSRKKEADHQPALQALSVAAS